MNLPNKLTLSRIICTAFMVAFLALPGKIFAWLAFAMFIAASITDYFDGKIARSRNLVTNLGKFMDPLADKILNYSVMVMLVTEDLIPVIALVIILFREFMVAGIRQLAAEQGQVIAANMWGKVKTVVQDAALIIILLLRPFAPAFLPMLSQVMIWVCAVLTVVSGVIYLVQNIQVLKEK